MVVARAEGLQVGAPQAEVQHREVSRPGAQRMEEPRRQAVLVGAAEQPVLLEALGPIWEVRAAWLAMRAREAQRV
jgi:hypothetical protein